MANLIAADFIEAIASSVDRHYPYISNNNLHHLIGELRCASYKIADTQHPIIAKPVTSLYSDVIGLAQGYLESKKLSNTEIVGIIEYVIFSCTADLTSFGRKALKQVTG